MFGFVLISAVTLMHVYVFWRAYSLPFLKRHVSGKLFIASGIALWSVFLLGRFSGRGNTGPIYRMLELLGMNWMAAVFLLSVSFLAVDLITAFGFILPRLVSLLRGIALLSGVAMSLTALVQGLRPPEVQNYDVQLSGLQRNLDGTVVVAMSDLHVGTFLDKQWLEERISQVQALKPDLVVLLGDIFEGHGEPVGELIPVLHRISAPLGVWAVLGNHEFHGRHNSGSSKVDYNGMQVLSNAWTEVRPSLILAGVDDLTANHRLGQGAGNVIKALESRPPGATVFLSHTPWQAERAAAAGVGLMLSGHTHGGQIWPFGHLVKRIYPLLAGRYEVNGMTVIVCRGTGTWGPRMRLWLPGEILRVTLHSE